MNEEEKKIFEESLNQFLDHYEWSKDFPVDIDYHLNSRFGLDNIKWHKDMQNMSIDLKASKDGAEIRYSYRW